MPIQQVNGVDLYYEVHGVADQAGARLLNISGTGSDLRRTFPGRLPLNRRFRVLSYDQRGLGQSSKPAGDYSMEEYADDAAALIGAVGWDRCHVMGTSFGGMVALNLAVRHPELIDRLVLNCTSPGGAFPSYPLHRIAELPEAEAFELRMRLYDRRWDPSLGEPIPDLGPIYDVIAARSRTAPEGEELAGLIRQLGARAGHDVVDSLDRIGAETLVCAGRYDDLAPLSNSECIADRMPHATLRVFDGGHFFTLQDRAVYRSIAEFLAGSG